MSLIEKPTESGVMGRAAQLPRAECDGWSRTWPFGGPHYFLRGMAYALCGSGASSVHPLNITPEPDGHLPEKSRKPACPHCTRLLKAGRQGHSR